jgi:hypothetical protein
VLAHTTLENWDKVYDYCQAYLTTSAGKTLGQFVTKNGAAVDLGSNSLTVNATYGSVFNLTGAAVTVKATNLVGGTTFQGMTTTSTITTSNGARVDTWYTTSAGRSVLILAPNIVSGSRYRLYNVTDSAEITNVVLGSTGIYYRLLWTTDKTVRMDATYQSGLTAMYPAAATGILTSTGLSFLTAQSADTIYAANGVNGYLADVSQGGEFTADLPNVRVNINDTDNTTSLARLYAWCTYYEITVDGIRSFLGCMSATDTANYFINGAIVDLAFYNSKSAMLTITGGYVSKAGGTSLVATTTVGAIYFDSGKAYVASSGAITVDLTAIKANTNLIPALL